MPHFIVLVCSFVSGFVSWYFASRIGGKSLSISAGVFAGFASYVVAWMTGVDDEGLGMMLAFGFPVLLVIFAGIALLGAGLANQTET